MPASTPPARTPTLRSIRGRERAGGPPAVGAPSPAARAVAFTAICLAGVAGGLIGYSLVRLQCDGECGLPFGLGIFAGAVIAAGGMSIVAVLVLRAVGEWRELQDHVPSAPGR